jgi:hypothetical protein
MTARSTNLRLSPNFSRTKAPSIRPHQARVTFDVITGSRDLVLILPCESADEAVRAGRELQRRTKHNITIQDPNGTSFGPDQFGHFLATWKR